MGINTLFMGSSEIYIHGECLEEDGEGRPVVQGMKTCIQLYLTVSLVYLTDSLKPA